MNNRRLFFLVLVVMAGIGLVVIIWWLVAPLLKAPTSDVGEQPPALPTSIQPTTPAFPAPTQPVQPFVRPTEAQQQESHAQDIVMQQAKTYATILGTYSSAEAFASLREMKVQATVEMQGFLDAERSRLSGLHPAYGPSWSQSIRALSARIQSPLPVLGRTEVEVLVQAQQTVESVQTTPVVSYQQATVKMTKVGDRWLASSVSWVPFEP